MTRHEPLRATLASAVGQGGSIAVGVRASAPALAAFGVPGVPMIGSPQRGLVARCACGERVGLVLSRPLQLTSGPDGVQRAFMVGARNGGAWMGEISHVVCHRCHRVSPVGALRIGDETAVWAIPGAVATELGSALLRASA